MIKLKKITPMVAKSGTNVGQPINVLFFTGKVPGTRVNYQNVLLALGVSKETAENEVKDNTATFIMSDAALLDFAKKCEFDTTEELITLGEGIELDGLELRMDFNTTEGRGVEVKDTVTGKSFKIATSIVIEGQGGLHDNRGWTKADTTVATQDDDAKKEAELTGANAGKAVAPKV